MPDPLFHAAIAYDVGYVLTKTKMKIDVFWFAVGAAAVDVFMFFLPAYFFFDYSFYEFYNVCRYLTHGIFAILIMCLIVFFITKKGAFVLWFFLGAVIGHWPMDMLSLEGIKMLYPFDPSWAWIHWDVFCQAMKPLNNVPTYWQSIIIWFEIPSILIFVLILFFNGKKKN
ncbi:MAG: metal-dependent hydrolase [Candidatus Goldbacteria bacterium]|nr:metal-dependent hydrolase [Candidatus Goldiibacteriota bacterium]